MHSLSFSKESLNLFDVENFVEDICERFNIQNQFRGNIIIALSEMIDLLEGLGAKGQLSFVKDNEYFKYVFLIESITEDLHSVFEINPDQFSLDTDYGKGIFSIMALCDDLFIDEDNASISLVFQNKNEIELSNHRKEFLTKYLGKVNESYQKTNV